MSKQKQFKVIQTHIEKATHRYPKPAKEKHYRAVIQISHDPTQSASLNTEIVSRLEKRMQKINWIVLSKALVLVHQLYQEGGSGFIDCLKTCSGRFFSLKNFVTISPPSSLLTHFVTKYAKYLEEKCSVYRLLGYQFEKNKTACKNIKAAKIKVVHKLQSQFNALLNIKMRRPLVAKNLIMHRVLLLVLRDSIVLYGVLNEGIISLMDEFWSMKKKDALKVVEIYKLFLRETDALLRLFEVGRGYSSNLPNIAKPDSEVVSSMMKYIARLDGQVISSSSESEHSASLYDQSEEYEDQGEPEPESEEDEAPPSSSSEEDQGDGGLAEFDDFLQDFVLRTLNLKNFQLRVDQNLLTTTIAPMQVGELQIPDMQYLMTGTKAGTPLTSNKTTSTLNFNRASSIPSLSSRYDYQPTPTPSFSMPKLGFQSPPQPNANTVPTFPVSGHSGLGFASPSPLPTGTNNPFAPSSGSSPFGSPGIRSSNVFTTNNPFATNPVATQQQPFPPTASNNPFATNPTVMSANNPFASLGGKNLAVPAAVAPPAISSFGTYSPPVVQYPEHNERPSSSSEEALPAPPSNFGGYGPAIIPVPVSPTSFGGLPPRQEPNNTANPFLKM